MAPPLPSLLQRLVNKFSNSRDFTISVVLHAVLLAVFGGTALYHVTAEPEDFTAGQMFDVPEMVQIPQFPKTPVQTETTYDVMRSPIPPTNPSVSPITTTAVTPLTMPFGSEMQPALSPLMTMKGPSIAGPTEMSGDHLSKSAASEIDQFTKDWIKPGGRGGGKKAQEYQFTAYVGQYSGGDWNSTVRMVQDKIVTGGLPNLLYLMSEWSKDKIKTNYKNVEAIRLDDWDTIATTKPPFIFLTGTQNFHLTEKEVENLRNYVRIGGCIWGDSSLPGVRSRFDIAFRREMRRVIPDVDKDFEPLPANHPIFTQAYFSAVKEVPQGMNFYQEPVLALKWHGEIAILYTANDYGDMWQTGLNRDGQIDLRRDQSGRYVAINPLIYRNRESYLRNITPEALETSFQFGTNVVIHLLTRWEDKVRNAPTL